MPPTVASYPARLACNLIDAAVVFAGVALVVKAGLIAAPALSGPYDLLDSAATLVAHPLERAGPVLLTVVATGLGYGIVTRVRGRTLGEWVLGLQLHDRHGRPARPVATALHGVGTVVGLCALALGHTWALADGERRTWAEIVSRTRLVRTRLGKFPVGADRDSV